MQILPILPSRCFENMFTPVQVYHHHTSHPRIHTRTFSEQIMGIRADCDDFEFSKAANPWETYLFLQASNVQVPHFKGLHPLPSPLFYSLSLTPSPTPHFPLPTATATPHGCNFTPRLNQRPIEIPSPRSRLHFKVDISPSGQTRGGGPTSKNVQPLPRWDFKACNI